MSDAVSWLYRQLFRIWRRQRFQWFLDEIKPIVTDRILDVGGHPESWTQFDPVGRSVDVLNIYPIPSAATHAAHRIRTLVGDGCHLDMSDGTYEIVFSNSVIEHVGDWEQQRLFAAEVARVGRSLWIQTPAYECPLEPHYLAPLIHYFPRWFQRRTIRWLTPRGLLERWSQQQVEEMVASTRLLTKREMVALFPGCCILVERMFGFIPKSYIAVRVVARQSSH